MNLLFSYLFELVCFVQDTNDFLLLIMNVINFQ